MAQSTKDMLKHEITVLQETLGIHLITTRRINSIKDGRDALVQIFRCFNSPKKDVTNELLTENKIIKHNLWAAEKALKESKEQLKKLSVELKKSNAHNITLEEMIDSYKNIIHILQEDRKDLITVNRALRKNNSPWWDRLFKQVIYLKVLRLAVRKEYFEQIKAGIKKEEYRLIKPYWIKRLSTKYDEVWITCGYPKKTETDKILKFKYNGFYIKKINHKEFGISDVEVYAIKLGEKI